MWPGKNACIEPKTVFCPNIQLLPPFLPPPSRVAVLRIRPPLETLLSTLVCIRCATPPHFHSERVKIASKILDEYAAVKDLPPPTAQAQASKAQPSAGNAAAPEGLPAGFFDQVRTPYYKLEALSQFSTSKFVKRRRIFHLALVVCGPHA